MVWKTGDTVYYAVAADETGTSLDSSVPITVVRGDDGKLYDARDFVGGVTRGEQGELKMDFRTEDGGTKRTFQKGLKEGAVPLDTAKIVEGKTLDVLATMLKQQQQWTNLFDKVNAKAFLGGGGRAWKRRILVRERMRKCTPLRVERSAFNRALRQCRHFHRS